MKVGFAQKYTHAVDRCGRSCVSVTRSRSNSDWSTDRPVVVTRLKLHCKQFCVVCGQTNRLWPRRRRWRLYPFCEFRKAASGMSASLLWWGCSRALASLSSVLAASYQSVMRLALITCQATMQVNQPCCVKSPPKYFFFQISLLFVVFHRNRCCVVETFIPRDVAVTLIN